MKLHFNRDGSIYMSLNLRGIRIEKVFSNYNEYLLYIRTI